MVRFYYIGESVWIKGFSFMAQLDHVDKGANKDADSFEKSSL